jgi:ATP-dependent DNA helicase RecG
MQSQVIRRLPFSLTPDQKTVLEEIHRDISGIHPMMRLLQGDVGSGKTLVAFLSSLLCIEAGLQVAFMAPTELLAKQHAGNASLYLEPVGVKVAFLSSSIDKEGKKNLIKALAAGEIHLLIGTHALFSRDVRFNNLGLVVVDEQQRFGVLQRLAMMGKGKVPDLLMMTATPIPRTMALTVFGDIDISTIHNLPPGRKPVTTHLTREGNEKKVYVRVREELKKGNQAYFVYPLIRQSEKLDLKDTETMFRRISRELFPDFAAGLIHSQIPEEKKEQTMDAFTRGKIKILVATSVVEVGVDVPAATCMVIEHAERFGLSALHQLRGRIGRGEERSYAFLIYSENLTDDARLRLKIMKENSDGFHISEEDLKLRGPGDIAGVRQSGYFRLKIADIIRDFNLLKIAKEDAYRILDTDPGLLAGEHSTIREVLLRSPSFSDELFDGG